MPFLDVLHLFLEPSTTIEDRASVFGKEWQVALEYVMRQPGLQATYTSHLSDKHDLWVFLVWVAEDDRSHFYHQIIGFGLLSDRMKKVPTVFFFGDDDYARLEETSRWAVHVSIAACQNGQAHERPNGEQEKRFLEYPGQYQFAARQERKEYEKLFEGNDIDYALVGILSVVYDHMAPKVTEGLEIESHEVELRKHQILLCPTLTPSNVNAAVDIADLTSRQPWEYGILSHDDGEYKHSAYPVSLSFRPMSELHMASKFLPAKSRRTSISTEARDQYAACITSASVQHVAEIEELGSTLEDLMKQLGLLDGREALREVRALRGITPSADSGLVRFVCTWNTPADLTRRWQATGSDACTKTEYTWRSEKMGWEELQWGQLPSMSGEQHWQKVNKILEIVDFKFEKGLTDSEKMAFEEHAYALLNTTSSCWSGDVDGEPVVHAETPVWTTTDEAPSSCLLFLAWDGIEQRRAWLRNFMAESFSWTGHIAYTLGAICLCVDSRTYEMGALYLWQETRDDLFHRYEEMEYDSDRDMGF